MTNPATTDEREDAAREVLTQAFSELQDAVAALRRDHWAGGPVLRGEPPRMPAVDALPTASSDFAYRLLALRGTPDIAYQCLRNAGGVWGWKVLATG